MKLYLQHKHNDAQVNKLWDKEVQDNANIMRIDQHNDCKHAAAILAAYLIGKMALDTFMAQVCKDFQSSPTQMAHPANRANLVP
jgi:hypothetical protein